MIHEPAEPFQRIDRLNATLGGSLTADWSTYGERGLAWLEIYGIDGDVQALRDGLEWLQACVVGAGEDPRLPRWRLALGLAHAERARHRWAARDEQGALADFCSAVDCLTAVFTDVSAPARERATAAEELGGLCWKRYWFVRYYPVQPDLALAEADRMLARIDPLRTAPADVADLAGIRLIAGLARLERYELTGDRADLDRGIDALLTATPWDLPAADRRRCPAGAELVDALRRRAALARGRRSKDGREDLVRAVDVARRIIAQSGPWDGNAWLLLNRYTASAAYALWRRDRRWADLDLAYNCWQVILPEGLDRLSAREYRAVRAQWSRGNG